MSKKEYQKTNFKITIGYKAVISVDVLCGSEEEAKKLALADFKKAKDDMFKKSKNVILEDDSYNSHGIMNMDETWNIL